MNNNGAVKELQDVFPALVKYRNEHTQANLQNLCVETMEFCLAIYASTRNDDEREIYNNMLKKLIH